MNRCFIHIILVSFFLAAFLVILAGDSDPVRGDDEKDKSEEAVGKKITIDLQNADIRTVLRMIAEVSGYNLVIDENVSGKVTVKLKDVHWKQALDVICRTHGLAYTIEGVVLTTKKKE